MYEHQAMLAFVHVMACLHVLASACMWLLWLSRAVHGCERATARSGTLEMCENELRIIGIARMSTKLCSLLCM